MSQDFASPRFPILLLLALSISSPLCPPFFMVPWVLGWPRTLNGSPIEAWRNPSIPAMFSALDPESHSPRIFPEPLTYLSPGLSLAQEGF